MINKKVLLRERKRHTARLVVSTPSVVLPGYPPWGGGYPDLGTPPGGYPDLGPPRGGTQTSVPPRGGTWTSVPPRGVPRPRYPPGGYLDLGTLPGGVPGPRYPPPGGYPDLGTPRGGVPGPWYPPPGGVPGPRYPPHPHGILGNVAKHYGIWVPPPVDRQMDGWKDRRVSKHYLPSYYVRGR